MFNSAAFNNGNIFNLTFVKEDKVLTALRAISLAAAVPRKHRINPVAGDSGGLGDVSVATVAATLTMAQGHVTLSITLNSDEAVIIMPWQPVSGSDFLPLFSKSNLVTLSIETQFDESRQNDDLNKQIDISV